MSIENKLVEKAYEITYKNPKMTAAIISGRVRQKDFRKIVSDNYVVLAVRYISVHGCSGFKCKRCPLQKDCDKNAVNSKDVASKIIALANSQKVSTKVDNKELK